MVSLAPAVLDLLGVRAGDRNLIVLTVMAGAVPMDLTGWDPNAQARLTVTDADAALEAETFVVDPTSGQVEIRWDGEDVRTLLAGAASWSGVWDFQIANAGEVVTVCAGRFTADMDVTRYA